MDLFSGLFGDMDDDRQYVKASVTGSDGAAHEVTEFDPFSAAGKHWLEKMANKQAVTGTRCHHISNNAPRNICDLDAEKRKQGVEVAKKWLDGAAMLGAKSMRVNSGGPRIAPTPAADPSSYPKNPELAQYLTNCIESFKEMADYGGKAGVKVTLQNHRGLTANPMNIRIHHRRGQPPVLRGFARLLQLGTRIPSVSWPPRLGSVRTHQRSCQVLESMEGSGCSAECSNHAELRLHGDLCAEYEEGAWDGVAGAKYLYDQVLAACKRFSRVAESVG